ncbi:hypothetical protein EMCRGX_G021459 [Ephydatia muelleri]
MLPTSSHKLSAQWQGPYKVEKRVGKVNYVIDMHDHHKRKRVFHINMLREFHSSSSPGPSSTACWTEEQDRGVDEQDDIPVWNGVEEDADAEVQMGEQLSEVQRQELRALLNEFRTLFSNKPGRTGLVEHCIETGTARPIRLPPCRSPKDARHKMAFVTPSGLYHFNVVPFGLKGAPASFQRLMDNIIRGLDSMSAAYIDDVIIFSTSWEDHLGHLSRVFASAATKAKTIRLLNFSKKLLPREERYSTIEKECLAIKMEMNIFRTYLIGRHFTVETDHRSLVWLDKLKDSNSHLTRWSLALQPYDFTVVHRSGTANGNVDCLSRTPWPDSTGNKFAAGEGGGVWRTGHPLERGVLRGKAWAPAREH